MVATNESVAMDLTGCATGMSKKNISPDQTNNFVGRWKAKHDEITTFMKLA